MIVPALDRKLFRDLWQLKGQLLAISLVIASGISTFVAMLSTLDSLDRAMHGYYSEQRFGDLFARVTRAPERVTDEVAAIPGVGAVETRVVADVTLDVPGTVEAVTGRIVSLPDFGSPRLNDVFLRRGRLPELGREDEVVVSEAFAVAHGLRPTDQLTAILNQTRKRLRIVGVVLSPEYVYAIRPGGVFPDDRLFGLLWMRREVLGHAFDMDGAFNDLSASLTRDARPDEVTEQIDRILEPYGSLGAYLRENQESNWYLENELTQLRSTGLVMPIVFLCVAAFLLNVVLSRLVEQQRDQIAVLKAFGYANLQVGVHYSKMMLVVVVLAAVLGAAGGAWMGQGMISVYADFFRFPALPYQLDVRYLAQALLVGAGAAALGTLAAIRRAVRLPPAEAMRPPAPEKFRAALVERLGLRRMLGTASRMVLRNVERRPAKSLMSVLGIGCGAALLVVGYALVDSMRYAIDVQFWVAQREDVQLSLVEPRSMVAMDDIRHLPGVLRAEPVRTVAARLRAGHRSRRTAVVGVPRDATLQRLVDEEIRPVQPPPDGLVLTTKLAEVLGVRAGDPIVLEVLQEKRPTLTLPVARVVESFIGMSAYMDLAALNRHLGEGPTISGANLLVDEAQIPAFHRQIKQTPVIAGVALRPEMLRSFEETAAESMTAMSFFMVLFAVVIAVGVVYNNARIILSERSRELASMRVLGYRRSEISMILLGELWLLTLLAIPVGLLMGYGLAALTLVGMDTELFRIALEIQPATYGIAAVIVALAAVVSGLVVRRRLDRLDLIEVLKTRE